MNRQRVLGLVALVGLVAGLCVVVRSLGRPESREGAGGVHVDSEAQLGPIVGLIPDGEWWAKADGALVLIQMVGQEGVAGIATKEGDSLLGVVLTMPEIEQLVYVLSGPDHVSTWVGRVPDIEIPPEAIGTDEDAITEIIVDRVDGAPAGTSAFRLLRSVRHDPNKILSRREVTVLERLRRAVEAEHQRQH